MHKRTEVDFTYEPSILQGDHVVNIDVRRGGPSSTIVGTLPTTRGRVTIRSNGDASAITLEDGFPRAAAARLYPVRKQVPVICSIVYLRRYAQRGQLGFGIRRRRYTSLSCAIRSVEGDHKLLSSQKGRCRLVDVQSNSIGVG